VSRPLVVAHRGSSYAVPEHTLAAYQQAIDEGADALECDVRLTRDGHLVCVHDRRTDRTSGRRGVVSELELADLEELDFGAWHPAVGEWGVGQDAGQAIAGQAIAGQDVAGRGAAGLDEEPDLDRRGVLTFDRLLSLVADAGWPVQIHVETKHPTRYAGLVEQTLVRMLNRYGVARPADPRHAAVTVMSFSPLGLRRVRLLAPRLPTVLLMERVPPNRRDGSLPTGVGIAGPSIEVVRAHPRYVHRVHEAGHRVHVWTVDRAEDIALVLDLGVDAVISNRPADVLRSLARPAG